ncbi:glycoside hydrolase [Rhizoclosmatium globosum]|uniref:Glycoside hydrolase n=1 Tax=Rhizoclosmatium globosum TaxID=329046 RepID=A0A1Y2BS88_9FUNG|nr:glycoside hydrolase [Rhizoclosmatium globosum]|eukprot:ORY37616.1 glycoside hydrolase [Rhizoclosmatium globosum]
MPLATLCRTTQYNIIHIKGILSYSTVKGFPGVDFNKYCSFPSQAFRGWPLKSANGLSLLDCSATVGKDITVCQSLGKKIILTIDPLDFMTANGTGTNGAPAVADNIWNLFLGGTSPNRPFGPSVQVDGLDFHIWSNNPNGVVDLATRLRTLMGQKYLFSASPRCAFPDFLINAQYFPTLSQTFDYITTFFLATPNQCGFRANPTGFWQTLQDWSTFTQPLPLIVGLAAWPVATVILATPGDYVNVTDFQSQNLVANMRATAPNFAGFSVMDASLDAVNTPCKNDEKGSLRRYSDVLWQQLTLPESQVGVNSAGSVACLAVLPPKTTTTSTTTTTTTTTTIDTILNAAGTGAAASSTSNIPNTSAGSGSGKQLASTTKTTGSGAISCKTGTLVVLAALMLMV